MSDEKLTEGNMGVDMRYNPHITPNWQDIQH